MRTLVCLTLVMLMSLASTIRGAATTNPASNPAAGTVSGSVVNSDGKAVPNQRVRLKRVLSRPPVGKGVVSNLAADALSVATVNTDKEGKFTQTLDPGEYWAESGSKTLGYAKERFTIKTGETTDVKLTLTKDEGQR